MVWLSRFDESLTPSLNWTIVDAIHSSCNKHVTFVKIKAMVDSKLKDSLGLRWLNKCENEEPTID